jgi:hypothetical protein
MALTGGLLTFAEAMVNGEGAPKADWRLRMCDAEWLTLTHRRGDPGRDNS